jgi:ubiquinone/menaquinone biosynthesis C-methylase UbiE
MLSRFPRCSEWEGALISPVTTTMGVLSVKQKDWYAFAGVWIRENALNNTSFVPETGFGIWFLSSETWSTRVLGVALNDLMRLLGDTPLPACPVVLDVGCGQGKAFGPLSQAFSPSKIIGLDADPAILEMARERALTVVPTAQLLLGSSSSIPLDDNSVDVLFCHQSFHHFVDHDRAIQEFFRVLKPGGKLLFAESTKAYIHSWIIRLLFRHPMDVQKTADEYLALIRSAGFEVRPEQISYPYLWWSRADLGLIERLAIRNPPPQGQREETLLNLVATKR